MATFNFDASKVIHEEWKDIEGFEGQYAISNYGRVKSLARNICRLKGTYCVDEPERIMKEMTHYKGHKFVFLSKNNKRYKRYVHRLVAIAFIPNPNDAPIVNHKNLKKHDNFVLNLEWVTDSENTQHYYDNRSQKEKDDDANF